jgi:6-phosphogluconate dehydrogenase
LVQRCLIINPVILSTTVGKDLQVKLGYIGLGKMGFNMVVRLLEKGHSVVAYNRSAGPVRAAADKGAVPAESVQALVRMLEPPRLLWLMVPHEAVDTVLDQALPHLAKGDTVIDGGNSHYTDSIRRADALKRSGVHFFDAGVSGGPRGARSGACIMVGGEREVFARYEALFRDLAAADGYAFVGPSGAGHFVKMVHNGIEYGMMQALAEGFAIMKAAPFNLDLVAVADLYDHRSVIESRLVGWLKAAFETYGQELEGISGSVAQSGEGRWTVEAAKQLGVPAPVIESSAQFRTESEKRPSYTGKILSALRNQFGGHEAKVRRGEG